jgi:hemolysin III
MTREKLFPYTVGEDVENAVSHGLGALFGIYAHIHLVYVAATNGTLVDVVAYAFFGLSMIMMFLTSTLYHAIWHFKTRDVFKRLDHSMIFILIVGTYTPFVFTGLKSSRAISIYLILVGIAVLGIVFKSLFVGKFKKVSTLLYVLMGWMSLFLFKEMLQSFQFEAMLYLVIGGCFYTVGAVIYALSKFKYHHLIWHVFVLLGAISHYIAIAYYLF